MALTNFDKPSEIFFEEERIPVYAGFWERFGAAFIDSIVLYAVEMILRIVLGGWDSFRFYNSANQGYFEYFTDADNIPGLLMQWLYYALMESSPWQATLGKRALSIRVINLQGGRITFGQASGRFFGSIISALIICIGYLMMLWDAKRQTLHDKMAGTLVVK